MGDPPPPHRLSLSDYYRKQSTSAPKVGPQKLPPSAQDSPAYASPSGSGSVDPWQHSPEPGTFHQQRCGAPPQSGYNAYHAPAVQHPLDLGLAYSRTLGLSEPLHLSGALPGLQFGPGFDAGGVGRSSLPRWYTPAGGGLRPLGGQSTAGAADLAARRELVLREAELQLRLAKLEQHQREVQLRSEGEAERAQLQVCATVVRVLSRYGRMAVCLLCFPSARLFS